MIDFIATGMDKHATAMILVDLQKAFDTLDHGVLLEEMKYFGFRTSVIEEMKYFGFRTTMIERFESYLSNRKFLVCIDIAFFSEAATLN